MALANVDGTWLALGAVAVVGVAKAASKLGSANAKEYDWEGVVKIRALVPKQQMHPDDEEIVDYSPYGPFVVRTATKQQAVEQILDWFHDEQGIEVLDHFDITVDVKPQSGGFGW